MNKKLEKEIAAVFAAPEPENKIGFLRTLPRSRISTSAFVRSQIPFIKKSVWVLSCMIVLPVLLGGYFMNETIVWLVSSFMPFLALLFITESTKSVIYGMNELEMAARFSLKSVILARLSILGIFNGILFVILIVVCYVVSGISMLQTGVSLLLPYLLTSNISLYLVRHFRNKETISWCMVVAVMVSVLNVFLHYVADFLFQTKYLFVWFLATVLLVVIMAYELYQIFKKMEDVIWSCVLTD